MYKNAWYMRLCALSRCIFSPSEYAFTINRQGRNTGGTAQASSGRRENPAAVADPLREIPAQATGRLQTDQKAETLKPPQSVQAAEDPRRKAGRLQTSSGHCADPSAVADPLCREECQRQRAQIRPLRPPQAVSERRESHSAIICTDEKKKAAAGVSGCRCQIHAAARSDQEGQAAQDAVGNPAAGKSHIGKLAGSRGRRSGLRDAQTGSDHCGNPAAVADPLREIPPESGRLQEDQARSGRSDCRRTGSGS